MKHGDTLYYKTEKDDFFHENKALPEIDESYEYIPRGFFKRLYSFILYRIVAKPLAFLYTKLKFRERYFGREKLKPYKKRGFFIYSNHTQAIADALTPNMLIYSKKVYVVVNKENLALPVIRGATVYLGALPLPDCLKAARNFTSAIKTRIDAGAAVAVYPEAHVWPYYTGIRRFGEETLEPVIKTDAPIFTATRVYKKRKRGNKPRTEIYVDGPFFFDHGLSKREARRKLADELYSAMEKRAALSDLQYIIYKKEES